MIRVPRPERLVLYIESGGTQSAKVVICSHLNPDLFGPPDSTDGCLGQPLELSASSGHTNVLAPVIADSAVIADAAGVIADVGRSEPTRSFSTPRAKRARSGSSSSVCEEERELTDSQLEAMIA